MSLFDFHFSSCLTEDRGLRFTGTSGAPHRAEVRPAETSGHGTSSVTSGKEGDQADGGRSTLMWCRDYVDTGNPLCFRVS